MIEPELIARARQHGNRIALRSGQAKYSYRYFLDHSAALASRLLALSGTRDLQQARVVFLAPAGPDYVSIQWAVWRAGGIAVPLSMTATDPELVQAITDSDPGCLIASRICAESVKPICVKLNVTLLVLDDLALEQFSPGTGHQSLFSLSNSGHVEQALPEIMPERRAMILYTSGTTGNPKGVVSTHENIQAQIQALIKAWEWCADDCIPLFLPLHHIHGVINILACTLWAGASVDVLPGFDIEQLLKKISTVSYTVFMAVPTVYSKLLQALARQPAQARAGIIDGFSRMRLMVSGSAALPSGLFHQWAELSGQQLLERYGMTETGMLLSNPLHGERQPATVGQPLPDVQVRLVSEPGEVINAENQPGEIQVRGPSLFLEYWRRPDDTRQAFKDGWFRTGDLAVMDNGYYRIMGRLSVDIIKSRGYKLSALEIEAVLIEHTAISECAVLGICDECLGERVAAAVVLTQGSSLDLPTLRDWCSTQLSSYKIPEQLLIVDHLPRNAMGKIIKPSVRALLSGV
ncbi:MAG: acyl-CoA synthetase [Endozoicomonas sp.]